MILYIVLLIVYLLLLIMITFFTLYFIIPLIKDGKKQDDPIIPKLEPPSILPKVRNITPYEQMEFVENVIKPTTLDERKELLNKASSSEYSSKKIDSKSRKYFKIWKICYRIIEHLNL